MDEVRLFPLKKAKSIKYALAYSSPVAITEDMHSTAYWCSSGQNMEEVAENSRIIRSLGSNDGCFKENVTSKFNLGRLMFYDFSTLVTLEEMGEEPFR